MNGADYDAATGWVTLSQAKLAGALDISKTAVNETIEGLVVSGLIEKGTSGHGSKLRILAGERT